MESTADTSLHEVPSRLLAWAGTLTGGTVRACHRLPTVRPAWSIDIEVPGRAPLGCVLRGARQQAFGLGSVYHLRREAAIVAALLRETTLPVPRVYALHEEPEALLMQRMPGSPAFGAPGSDASSNERMLAGFVGAIAQLHATPLAALARGAAAGYLQPPADPAREELAIWSRLSVAALPDPLLDIAFEDLARDPPPCPGAVLVQGDTGPNQCLFEDGRLSALLDWELAHAGDPMEDLGWIAARAFYADFGSLGALFADYASRSGIRPEPRRIAWYRTLALLKCAIATGSARRNAEPGDDIASILCWDAITRAALLRCLSQRCAGTAPTPALAALAGAIDADLAAQQAAYGERARLHAAGFEAVDEEPVP